MPTRSIISPPVQPNGDIASPWTTPYSPGTYDRIQYTNGWMASDSNASHNAVLTHGVTTTGDWQLSVTADAALAATGAAFVSAVSAALNGYTLRVGATIRLRLINAGVTGATILDPARALGAYVPTFIELTYDSAANTFSVYENGRFVASATDSTYEATDKADLFVNLDTVSSPTNETRCKDLFIQDYIDVRGFPPPPQSTNPVWRSSLALR